MVCVIVYVLGAVGAGSLAMDERFTGCREPSEACRKSECNDSRNHAQSPY